MGDIDSMPDPISLKTAAAVLRPLANAVLKQARRLCAERKAGRTPLFLQSSLLEKVLDETLVRLQGGSIEDARWKKILSTCGQEYVSPDFVKEPALQEWLAEEQVATDLKLLATKYLLIGDENNDEPRTRLIESYASLTGEANHLANEPIDVVLAILLGGYLASIPSDQHASTGISQAGFSHMNGRFDRIETLLSQEAPDPITQKAHTEVARTELSNLLLLRVIDPLGSRRNIQTLLSRTRDGDLAGTTAPIKAEIFYWAIRLCAVETETLATAQKLREELVQINADMDLTAVDALLAEANGRAGEALRLVRDKGDSDSRSVCFAILSRSEGEQAALDWWEQRDASDNPLFFTAIGWINWAVCSTKGGKWEEAARQLIKVETLWPKAPTLAFVEGRINAAMLIPEEYRGRVIADVPLYTGFSASQGRKAEHYHARAKTCFDFVSKTLTGIADQLFMKVVADWCLWLRIVDPDASESNAARDEIRQRMGDGPQAVDLIPFATVFNIPFDTESLEAHLDHRKRFGGLNDQELLAESLLFQESKSPRQFFTYLEEHWNRLREVLEPAFLTTMQVEALVRDGQTKRARALIASYADDLGEQHANRLNLLIDTYEGNDPRIQLERLYIETKNLVDLRNLVSHLKTINDRAALHPLVVELFDRERTINNALDVVRSLSAPSFFDHDAVIEFLDDNADLVVESDGLKAVKAWALFQAGRIQDAKTVNDNLLSSRTNQDDFNLDINIAVSSGHWEHVSAAIDREWPRRDSHTPTVLIRSAYLAGQRGLEPDRALELARLAAEKAPDDPGILAAAYWLYFKLGLDGEADPKWLLRASELSSTQEGPVWCVDLKDVVNDFFPKRRDLLQEVERKWFCGEIPLSMAAGVFNVSLARMLLHLPARNAVQLDGRQRMMLPIVSGARSSVELQESWTVGLDVTSVMVLAYLGLLEQAIGAFHHVKLAPSLMEALFQERDETRFHQPSRIAAAREVRDLERAGQIQTAAGHTHPPDALTNEVGVELATLLHTAEHDDGMVVCVLPIYKLGSLMEQSADVNAQEHAIFSTTDICNLLHEEGKIEAEHYQRAMLFLNSEGQRERSKLDRSSLKSPIYIDDLAISYLQNAGILGAVAAAGLNIRVHPNLLQRAHTLIKEGDIGHELGTRIEGIRTLLRNAVDRGAASFLPRVADRDERIQKHELRFQVTASLLAASAACDALCIDDRYINSHANITNDAGQDVPIACALDVLRHLCSQGVIDIADHWAGRHKLRRGGFAFLYVETDELAHWLRAAKVVEGQMLESAELMTLRQAISRIDSLGLPSPKEAMALSTNLNVACKTAIERLWGDASLAVERVKVLSDWVWHNLMKTTVLAVEQFAADNRVAWIRDLISQRLGHLLLPAAIQSEERRAQFTDWIEHFVLAPLRPANPELIETALATTCHAISALEDHQEAYGNVFLEQLPSFARKVVISNNPEFAERCGFQTKSVLEIGADLKLWETDLVAAVREVFVTDDQRTIRDVSGKNVSVGCDSEKQHVVLTWDNREGTSQHASLQELAILSPTPDTRRNALRSIVDRIGATGPDFLYSSRNSASPELSDQHLSDIFAELTDGVIVVQSQFTRKLERGLPINVTDVTPESISYFETFCGPNPNDDNPETYFRKQLIPYRQGLLKKDLQAGLDICLLGALRDDLMPGQWLSEFHDDVVWDALVSCNTKNNLFSLLGALDIVLYRQSDARFAEFATEAVEILTNEKVGHKDDPDLCVLLPLLFDLVLNRIHLLESGATYPGYWKRMCAWMQAGFVVRALLQSSAAIDASALEEWTYDSMTAAGNFAEFMDARDEPMIVASRTTSRLLKEEILDRLKLLKWRHKNDGRQVPPLEDIDRAPARAEDAGEIISLGFPGPLEGHRRPTVLIPKQVSEEIEEASVKDTATSLLQRLVTISQLFALGDSELDCARNTVSGISHEVNESNLESLWSASIVAAANRDAILADNIADAVVRMVPQVIEAEEVHKLVHIMLQAAAAHKAHDTWFEWLEEKLMDVATQFPSPPNECLEIFQEQLDEIAMVLPIDSWFYLRADSIASSGMA